MVSHVAFFLMSPVWDLPLLLLQLHKPAILYAKALVSSTGTFRDTVIICALTGLVITSSIIAYPDIDYHNGAALTKAAFSKIPYIGAPLLTFGLATFAFSTTLGWSYYGERCVEYLKGKKWMLCYRMLYIASIFAGSVISLGLVWNIADCMNALMAIPNLSIPAMPQRNYRTRNRKYLRRDRLDRDMEENEIEELEEIEKIQPQMEEEHPEK